MAGAGKKTFTAGETLTASDVNTYLMEQSVMVFGGTAARSSAIPTPSEGMTSYRTDTQQIESYDGAEWRGMSGLQLVKKQTIGSAVSSVTVTGAFSATYENYKIIVVGGVGSATSNLILAFPGATTGYYQNLVYATYVGGSPTNAGSNNATNWPYAGEAQTDNISMSFDLLGPFIAKTTKLYGEYIALGSHGNFGGYLNNTNSYTGFSITPTTGTLTGGTIYVYGYGT